MRIISVIAQLVIPLFVLFVVLYGMYRKVRVYDVFISGAKDAFSTILSIFPYLLAIFVAVKTFQASGAFDFTKTAFSGMFAFLHVPIEVLQVSIVKPLSGSASLGVFTDIVKTTGADSEASRISAVIMGSAETTFYVIAVYLGSVGLKNSRYLVPVCLISDVIGIIISVSVVKLFY